MPVKEVFQADDCCLEQGSESDLAGVRIRIHPIGPVTFQWRNLKIFSQKGSEGVFCCSSGIIKRGNAARRELFSSRGDCGDYNATRSRSDARLNGRDSSGHGNHEGGLIFPISFSDDIT